jgi:hypothetical protein
MHSHKFIDANGNVFTWYSAKAQPLYNVVAAASAWFARSLVPA